MSLANTSISLVADPNTVLYYCLNVQYYYFYFQSFQFICRCESSLCISLQPSQNYVLTIKEL
uniref:Uncharacterized protein n=1 Tax=Arundo donax TaxID=35708 RepID=A0A0A9GYZ4_ARUDO